MSSGALLDSDSIELTTSEVPLAERDLLGTAQVTVRCTPDQLLERMSRAFDEVKTVVARFGEAWDKLSPRLAGARRAVEEAQELAVTLGERDRADLAQAARTAELLRASLSSDPLSVAPDEVDRLTRSLRVDPSGPRLDRRAPRRVRLEAHRRARATREPASSGPRRAGGPRGAAREDLAVPARPSRSS